MNQSWKSLFRVSTGSEILTENWIHSKNLQNHIHYTGKGSRIFVKVKDFPKSDWTFYKIQMILFERARNIGTYCQEPPETTLGCGCIGEDYQNCEKT